MYKMEQFIQSSVMLIILCLFSIIYSGAPYLCILFSGLLMIILTLRSLLDDRSRVLGAVQVIFSLFFSIISFGFIPFLIFYECRFLKPKQLQIAISATIYGVTQIIMRDVGFPIILFNMLMLTVISIIIYLIEMLLINYITVRNQVGRAISVTAVNEMYEKKLNHELVMKNYLVDKNARLEERENISRNIHNSVGHSITAAIMTLDAADMLFESSTDKARDKMNTANKHIRASLNTIRHAVRILDSESAIISMNDFISELNAVTESFVMDTMIVVRTDFSRADGNLMIPREHTEFLTGAVQELLTNGVRHGKADMFSLILSADSGHIKIIVSDNGESDFTDKNQYERIKKGFGLKKLISYAEKCGGTAVFTNVNGFKSAITLPLYKEDEHAESIIS